MSEKDKNPLDEHAKGAASVDKTTRSNRIESVGAFVTQLLAILYPVGTVLGLVYAHWYYNAFEINFLGHATPLDLLLIALANANKVVIILMVSTFLTVTFVLAFLVALLIAWSTTALLITAAILIRFGKVVVVAVVTIFRYVVAALALVVSVVLYALLLPIIALRDRASAARLWSESTDGGEADSSVARWLVHWWRRALRSAKISLEELFQSSTEYRKDALELYKGTGSVIVNGAHFVRGWWGRFSLVVLVTISLFVAIRSGQVDSECVLWDKEYCTTRSDHEGYFENLSRYGEKLFAVFKKKEEEESKLAKGRAFVVPTANVATLSYFPSGLNSGRRHVRVTIRQSAGVGEEKLPKCLTDVGSTESVQFLFDFDNDRAQFAKKEECSPKPGAGGGGCEWTSRIGPFPLGSASLDVESDQEEELADCRRRSSCVGKQCSGLPALGCLVDDINAKADQGLIPAKVRLIGRADSVPISNSSFRSNDGLAQARAEAVWELLRSMGWDWLGEVDVLRLIGGPLSAGDCDVCDRSVDVHICWKPVDLAERTVGR